MNRLYTITLTAVLLWAGAASAERGGDANVCLNVVNPEGQPVSNATVHAAIWAPGVRMTDLLGGRGGSQNISGKTDMNGLFSVKGEAYIEIGWSVVHQDFYKTVGKYVLARHGKVENGRWQPWGKDLVVVLRPRVAPIPMCATMASTAFCEEKNRQTNIQARKENRAVSFDVPEQRASLDLAVGEWLPPHGNGKQADLTICFSRKVLRATEKGRPLDMNITVDVSFPNEGDGVIRGKRDHSGSSLVSAYEAPAEGYEPTVGLYKKRRDRIGYESNMDEDALYYLRVRTELDKDGNIKSAHYGKIYGELYGQFVCYLNPTPNDRNVEFDSSKNLLGSGSGLSNLKP